jgi:hypothetical protein
MKLSPQHRKILYIHQDGQWVCSTAIEFIRDQRKRISELNAGGYVFEAQPCDRRCRKAHHTRLLMRRLVQRPQDRPTAHVQVKETPQGPIAVLIT